MRLEEHRFSRFESIEWWDQQRLSRARVLVVGAGALGNEVLKNLALLGVGHLVVVDRDLVEESNLCRSVLFRSDDEGQAKAEVAVCRLRELYPALAVRPLVADVCADVGLGLFRWADIVVGALDNREARVFVNAACARVGRPWIDGGLDVLNGVVRGFWAPETACYECTMSSVDWKVLNQARSCSLLARRAVTRGGAPTTPTTASVIGAIQAQEVVKHLHGMQVLLGRGFVFEGHTHNSYTVDYQIHPECGWHEAAAEVESAEEWGSDTPMQVIWLAAAARLATDGEGAAGTLDALDLSRELVSAIECVACGERLAVFRPLQRVTEDQARCGRCGAEGVPRMVHSLSAGSELLAMTPRSLGLPAWDVVWARRGARTLAFELSADRQAP